MTLFETYSKPIAIAVEVYDCENRKRWSGPFPNAESAHEIVRNLRPIYPNRKFRVNEVLIASDLIGARSDRASTCACNCHWR